MTNLARIQRELNQTAEAIAHAERSLALHRDLPSAVARLRAYEKQRENLERQFEQESYLIGLDVCRYRIELGNEQPAVESVANVLAAFQRLFTAVYAAIPAPRQTTKVAAETEEATTFGFAYTFPGSLGIAMTLKNERLLLKDTRQDEAISGVFDVMRARNVADIKQVNKRFGVATVRVAHEWAAENARAGFGADISWKRKDDVKVALRVQPPEIKQLKTAISETTAEDESEMVGELVMADTVDKRFKMRVNDKIIEGDYTDAISAVHSAKLPAQYTARIKITSKILTSESDTLPVSYFLVRLSPS